MNFTVAQKKALLFIIAFFCLAAGYNQLQNYLNPAPEYDFQPFEAAFLARLDSIKAQSQTPQSALNEAAVQKELPQRPPDTRPKNRASAQFPVNINTADLAALTRLPRIGPKIASRIIEHRAKIGSFRDKKVIMDVKGIGPATFARLEHLIIVE